MIETVFRQELKLVAVYVSEKLQNMSHIYRLVSRISKGVELNVCAMRDYTFYVTTNKIICMLS